MNSKILITGPPRSGKSTLISKLLEFFLKRDFTIYGFLTPEVRERGVRIGFDIVDIHSGKRVQLARVGDFKTEYKLGKYSIFINNLERYLDSSLILNYQNADIIIIDEIGKMELFSENFYFFVQKLFFSELLMIASIGLNLNHPIKNHIQNIPNIQLLKLNRQNFQFIFKKLISLVIE